MDTKNCMRAGTALALLTLVLAGCASSGYKAFYTPVPGVTPENIAKRRAAPAPPMPTLEKSAPANPEQIVAAYAQRGYGLIGYSSFNSGARESEQSALEQGQAVGADIVLVVNPTYTGSVTSNLPITTPTTTTSYTSGTATAYGSAGSVNVYGNSTTTTYGSQTTYIPITTHRNDYAAAYFVRQRFTLGAYVRNLEDQERQQLQTNQAVVVQTVVNDTPAFYADILPGDVLLDIDGTRIPDQTRFGEITDSKRGQTVVVTLSRNGAVVKKEVQLNP
ncbi:PDZ domain-containing protein [Arenimonas aestuarii]